jgi:hypothetical protein
MPLRVRRNVERLRYVAVRAAVHVVPIRVGEAVGRRVVSLTSHGN